MKKIIPFEVLIEAVMSKFLEKPTQTNLILRKQYACSRHKREFTGKGFFVDFILPSDISKVQNHLDLHANGKINNNIDVGFILFIKNGILDCLEGFTYYGEWPEKIMNCELFYEKYN